MHGIFSYLETSRLIASRSRGLQPVVLARILLAKALSGLSAFEYGLYGLHDKPLLSVTDYLTKKQTTALFDRVNLAEHRPLVDDKLLFHRRCQRAGLPTPDILAILSVHGIGDGSEKVFRDFPAVMKYFVGGPRIDLILKPRRDSLGTGIRFVSLRDGGAFDLQGGALEVERFTNELAVDMQRDDYLVQPFLSPHPEIASLGAGRALGTLRVLTFLDGEDVHILYAFLRIPAEGNVHDNFGAGANGNLIAGVDPTNGRLSVAFGRAKSSPSRLLQRYECNPSTGARIEGVPIPHWKEVEGLISRSAIQFSELPCLAWDVAVTPDGPILIEANANADIIGAQVCCGGGAKTLLAPVIARYC